MFLPVCYVCVHYRGEKYGKHTCRAYPEEIPKKVLLGMTDIGEHVLCNGVCAYERKPLTE